jgi:outer membrane protein TolC
MRRVLVALAFLIGGCAVGPDYKRPALELPDSMRGADAAASSDSIADQSWAQVYGDPILRTLLATGIHRPRRELRRCLAARRAAPRQQRAAGNQRQL